MLKQLLILFSFLAAFSLTAPAQEMTVRDYARAHGLNIRSSHQITLSLPQACTISRQHLCVYYGGDIDPNDPEQNGLSNENTLYVSDSWTYNEVSVPVSIKISAAFTNNLQTYALIDPQTANWQFRTGVDEGYGGTLLASGTTAAQLNPTGRFALEFEEYQLLTRTPVSLPKGNVWFDVQPNCTNENNPDCSNGRYFESDTDGLNGINSKFTVTSNTGMGPTLYSPEVEIEYASWCDDGGVACGDGMSSGLLK